jgi:hypothetical protein
MNPTSASFCWQCFASFAPANAPAGASPFPAPPPGTPLARPFSTPAHTPASASARRSSGKGKIVGLIGLGIVAALLARGLFATDLSMPETIGGIARNHTGAAAQAERQAESAAEVEDLNAESAVYGDPDPEYFVLAVADPADGQADETFTSFTSGFTAGSAGAVTVDVEGRTTSSAPGATYICAGITGSIVGTFCMWQTDSVAGFVLAFDKDEPQALQFAHNARDAVGS